MSSLLEGTDETQSRASLTERLLPPYASAGWHRRTIQQQTLCTLYLCTSVLLLSTEFPGEAAPIQSKRHSMSTPPLLTVPQIRSDLELLARNRTLLDPFLPSSSSSSQPAPDPASTTTSHRIDPSVPPANATESLVYAAGFMDSTRRGVLELADGTQVGEMGGRLERVKVELDGLSAGLQGH